MTPDELLAKFENWWLRNGDPFDLHKVTAREAWQAAHASRDAEVEMLRRDAERLTWFETQREAYGFEGVHEGNRWTIEGPFNTLRKAIDAVMQEERK